MQLDDKYIILRCEKLTEQIVADIEQVRADLTEQLKDEKIQESVGKVFAQLKEQAQIHNYLTRESTTGTPGGVQQTSGTQTKPTARPAGTATRTPAGGGGGLAGGGGGGGLAGGGN
jgi:hypothetical protein